MKVVVLKNNKPFHEASWPDGEVEEGFEAFIGRSEDCHVLIDDPLISRHHLVLRFERRQWQLEKLSDLAIVTVNGQQLATTLAVQQGDLVVFPPYSLALLELPGTRPAAKGAPASEATQPFTSPDLMATQTGLSDDIPEQEELDATAVMPRGPAATVRAPLPPAVQATSTLPMSERTQELVENILSDDEPASASEPAIEEPANEEDAFDGMNFGGEEDVIGSTPSASEEPAAPAQEESFAAFQGPSDEPGSALAALDDAGGGDESTRVMQKFASYELQLFGEFAPYDRYALEQPEIFIGRDPKKCQIVLNDSEVSSVHAVLKKSLVNLTLEDLNSSNGTLLNGQRINRAELTNGDEFIVGSTTFTVKVVSDLLESESDRLMPVEQGQMVERIEEVEEEVPLDAMGAAPDGSIDFTGGEAPQEKSIIKRIMKDPKKKRIAMILGVLLLVALLMEEEPAAPKKKAPEKKTTDAKVDDKAADPKKTQLSPEQVRALEARYKIAEAYVKDKKLDEALAELEQILAVDPSYANAKTLYTYVQEQNKKFKEEQERIKQEEERARIRDEVKTLLAEAKEAVKERNVTRAEQLFAKILEKDPENLDVTPLRLDLEAWQAQERAKAEAEARAKAERTRMVEALSPGKKLYLAREWYKAVMKLDEFMGIKPMAEDLLKEGADMLADAKVQLAAELAPLLGKARSLKEGQDLKGAYEIYLQVLAMEPTNKEGLDEVTAIREQLDNRSKKVYREAIISESLSLFTEAKEKFQEVQQISPTDSEYYKKATEKLKNYLE